MKASILFLFIFFISFSAQAQVGATITPCTEGAQNGAINLTFPAGYPEDLVSFVSWYQIIDNVEVPIIDADLNTLHQIEGLLPGTYRVSLNRAGWCQGTLADFVVGSEACPLAAAIATTECIEALGKVKVSVQLNGGSASYYNANGLSNAITITGNSFTTPPLTSPYEITITDISGCSLTLSGEQDCVAPCGFSFDYFEVDCVVDNNVTTLTAWFYFPEPLNQNAIITDEAGNSQDMGIVTVNSFAISTIFLHSETILWNGTLTIGEAPPCDIQITNLTCNSITIGDDVLVSSEYTPPPSAAPVFGNETVAHQMCAGAEYCIPYSASDPDGGVLVGIMSNTGEFALHNHVFSQGNTSTGEVCFTPDASNVGNHIITLIATDETGSGYSVRPHLVSVLPRSAVSGFLPNQTSPVLLGCNGEVVEYGTIEFIPQYPPGGGAGVCPPLFTINGNPSSNTIFLQSAEPRNFIISCAGIGHPIQVVPQTEEVKNELQIDLDIVEPRHICEDLLCEGLITLDVQGARGNYSVQWFKDGVLWCEYSGSQPMGGGVGTNCQTSISGLCSGNYSVIVTDLLTGCSASKSTYLGAAISGDGNGGDGQQSDPDLPAELRVYPTIFDNSTTVKYEIPADARVTLIVYDLNGIPVKILVDEEIKEAGEYIIPNEGNDLNNGLYLYSIKVCDEIKTKYGIKY